VTTDHWEVSDLLQAMTYAIPLSLNTTLVSVHCSMQHVVDFATSSVMVVRLAVTDALDPGFDNARLGALVTNPVAMKLAQLHKLLYQYGTEYKKVCELDSAHVLPDPYKAVWFTRALHNRLCHCVTVLTWVGFIGLYELSLL
jgi:hypothetical protein